MPQQFHRGDVVRVAQKTGRKTWPGDPWPGAGEEAIVVGSYWDQFGGSREPVNGHSYTLLFQDRGRVSWYYEPQLSFIRHDENAIQAWTDTIEARKKEQSDLAWIVQHWPEHKDNLPGASCEALMALCGIDNPWGSHGEGFVWYQNAMITITALRNALDTGDIEQVKARAAEIRQARRG